MYTVKWCIFGAIGHVLCWSTVNSTSQTNSYRPFLFWDSLSLLLKTYCSKFKFRIITFVKEGRHFDDTFTFLWFFFFKWMNFFSVTKTLTALTFFWRHFVSMFTTHHLRTYLARSSLNWIAESFGVFCVHVSVIKMTNSDNFLKKKWYILFMFSAQMCIQ